MHRIIAVIILFTGFTGSLFAQSKTQFIPGLLQKNKIALLKNSLNAANLIRAFSLADSTKKNTRSVSLAGLFLSVGGGLDLPLGNFHNNSNSAFGILGRLEYSSTSIFPFIIGGGVHYFVYNGQDEFKTANLLTTFKTSVLAFGLTVDVSLAKFIRSTYTMPFITFEVKYNNITREITPSKDLTGLPLEEKKIGIGAGLGFTLFIFDIYAKYTFSKDMTSVGVFTKVKVPVLRF